AAHGTSKRSHTARAARSRAGTRKPQAAPAAWQGSQSACAGFYDIDGRGSYTPRGKSWWVWIWRRMATRGRPGWPERVVRRGSSRQDVGDARPPDPDPPRLPDYRSHPAGSKAADPFR